MKKIHPGEISLVVAGNVSVSGGEYSSEIKVNDKPIAENIAEALGISKDDRSAEFIGDVSLVIHCIRTEPEIQNTMTDGEGDAPEPEIEDIPLNWGSNKSGGDEKCVNLS